MEEAIISGLAFRFRFPKTYPRVIEYHREEILNLI